MIVKVAWRVSSDIRPFAYVLQRISRLQNLVAETVTFPSVAARVCGVYRDRRIAWRTFSVFVRCLAYTRCGGWGRAGGASCVGSRWGRALCGVALGVLVFRGVAEGNTSTSRKTQNPIASSSDEDVPCINIKIVSHLRTQRRRAIK